MRVLQVSPAYFAGESCVGGGERYAYELARALARRAQTVFLSFGPAARSAADGPLRVEILPRRGRAWPGSGPLSRAFLRWVRWAEVVHCHQVHALPTDTALILARLMGRRAFVTDLGGGERWALSYHLPLLRWAHGLLLISEYSRRLAAETPAGARPGRLEVVWGGVDTETFSPAPPGAPREGILFVGRLLPHKGVDCLIEAVDGSVPLDVVGRVHDGRYLARLRALAAGKPVRFHTEVDDAELAGRYRRALVTVQPSVYEDCFGGRTRVPELLGLAALESQACGTPAIVTAVAALPEVVRDGVTGFVVPPNDPGALRERIRRLAGDPAAAAEMGRRGRLEVERRFTWDAVAARCAAAYAGGGP